VFDENVSGLDTVVDCRPPVALVDRSPERIEEMAKADVVPRPLEKKRLVEDAVVAKNDVAVAFWSVVELFTKRLFATNTPVEVALPV
jgi:hypothetical protein